MLAFFLSQNKNQFIHHALSSPSLPQSPTCPPLPSSLPPCTLSPALLIFWDHRRAIVEKYRQKHSQKKQEERQIFLIKTTKVGGKKRQPVTAQEGITFWPLIIQRERKGRERERCRQGLYSTTSHVCCYLFTAFLLFLCLSCPPSERVLFSQLLVIEGGRKQTQIKAQAALVQGLCV